MITADWVVTRMHAYTMVGYEWVADYFAQVAEACRKEAHSPENLPGAVESTLRQLKAMHRPRDGDIRKLLFETLEYEALVMSIPDQAENIAFPVRPVAAEPGDVAAQMRRLLLTKHQGDLDRIRLARTPARDMNGELLSIAAIATEGNFHWMPAGPDQGPGRSFFPKERGGEDNTRDAFAYWLNRGGKEPDSEAYMNCWEAVFFSAYRAGLVSVQRLRLIHAKATLAGRAEGGGGASDYFSSLINALGFHRSASLVPEIGLMPRPGDIIFIAEDHHVAVCVDINDDEGVDAVIVMSLWRHPRDGFSLISVSEFGPLVKHARFAPCPFV